MIVAGIPGPLYKGVLYFWAAGPQLVLCMWLGYAACRRRGGRMLDWLIGAFVVALVPIVGVVVMYVLWRRSRRSGDAVAGRDEPPATPDPTR